MLCSNFHVIIIIIIRKKKSIRLSQQTVQPATSDPFCHATEHAAVGSTSNPSDLPDYNELQLSVVKPPPYNALNGKHAPDASTDNQSSHDGTLMLSPPDYASASASVPVSPVTNI